MEYKNNMENENKLKIKNVETYTDDVVKTIENDKSGLVKKIIHEEEKHEAEKINLSPKSKKNKFFMVISIIFILLAFAILVFLAFFYDFKNTVPVAPQFSTLIFTDQNTLEAVDGYSKDKIMASIYNEATDTKVKIGGIEGIYLTENKNIIGFKRFNTLIKSNIMEGKMGLFGDSFLIGTFKSGLSSVSPNIGDPFMLIRVRSFSDIFLVMRDWENKMLYDLYGFLGIKVNSLTNYLFTKDWEEGIISNKNARILKDNDGNIVLMYVFIDDTSIVISNSENAVREVVYRLNSSKIKK